jgi:hypothetical protein
MAVHCAISAGSNSASLLGMSIGFFLKLTGL